MDALTAALVVSLAVNLALYCRMCDWRERYEALLRGICGEWE
jgi:hypothetical protein